MATSGARMGPILVGAQLVAVDNPIACARALNAGSGGVVRTKGGELCGARTGPGEAGGASPGRGSNGETFRHDNTAAIHRAISRSGDIDGRAFRTSNKRAEQASDRRKYTVRP